MDQPPIIVGAGPVGLGAAVLLAQQGRAVRIVESRDAPSRESRALAVNPRTLELLEGTGVTRRILEQGLQIRGADIHRRGGVIASLSFEGIHPRYPFMVALSQASTERLLERALNSCGVGVERAVRMRACRNVESGVEASFERSDRSHESVYCPWLLAADGAHSTARSSLGVDFPGNSFAREWQLADVPLRTALEEDRAHIFFREGGAFQFLVRVIDERLEAESSDPLWRVITNCPAPLERLAHAEQTGSPVWASGFRISHRLNAAMTVGSVHFAGDAAHIHSPAGARGMNLGIEDAWVFAQLVDADALPDYERLRRPVARQVVRQVELLSRVAAAETYTTRLMRAFALPPAVRIPAVRGRMMATLTGLDHALPAL